MDETHDVFWGPEERQRLGKSLAAWMAWANLKKLPLSRDTGVARTTIDNILAGAAAPGLETIARLANRLGATTGALLDGALPPAGSASQLPTQAPIQQGAGRADDVVTRARLDRLDDTVPRLRSELDDLNQRYGVLLDIFANHVPAARDDLRLRRLLA